MKKLILTAILALSSIAFITAQSANYVDWEWDVLKMGYATPIGSDFASAGISFGTELRYNATDNMSIGLSFEGAGFSSDFGNDTQDIGVSGSSMLVVDRYLKTDSGTRGFFGLGIGNMSSGTVEVIGGNAGDAFGTSSSFAIAPRAGFELGHGRLMAQYNHSFKGETTNHLSVTLALTLWGGYK
ncbi:MAG: hypothetical protein ACJA01_001618 [Saprospiraceae bacterium]|jgi:hypothetical protein